MKEQLSSEIAVNLLNIEDLERTPKLLDDMQLCAGCEDKFVLKEKVYCTGCQEIHRQLEERCPVSPYPGVRHNAGIVDYERPSPWPVRIILLGALSSAMFLMTAMWFVGRGLVGFCLTHSR